MPLEKRPHFTPARLLPFFLTLIILCAFFTYYSFFSVTDSVEMLNISVSTYELLDPSIGVKTNIDTGENLLVYSRYGLGLPFFLVPFLFLNDVLNGVSSVNSNMVLSLPNVLVIASIAQVVFLILTEMGYAFGRSIFLSLLSVFGTFMYPYENGFLSEPLQALCIAAAFLFVYKSKKKVSYVNLMSGGVFIGYAVLTKATVLALLPLFVLYVFAASDDRGKKTLLSAGAFLLPVSLFGVLIASLNYYRFGSPFAFGYGELSSFGNPVASGVYNFLFNPDKSLFLFAPIMLLFPLAIFRFAKNHAWEGILIAALITVNLIIHSAWWAWEGGQTWGPRFLLPLIPLSVVPFASLLDRKAFTAAASLLFAAGFAVNLLGVLQNSGGFHYIVMRSTENAAIETIRPNWDYLDREGRMQAPPHVVSSTIPEFNILQGHIWLLGSKMAGWRAGDGLKNPSFKKAPWIERYPRYQVPDLTAFPLEIRLAIECPPPLALKSICGETRPTAPYYHDALLNQAAKAEALGYADKAARLRKKAAKEEGEKRMRDLQLNL